MRKFACVMVLVLACGCGPTINPQAVSTLQEFTNVMDVLRSTLQAVRPILLEQIDENICDELETAAEVREIHESDVPADAPQSEQPEDACELPDPRVEQCEQYRTVQEALDAVDMVLAMGEEVTGDIQDAVEGKYGVMDWIRFAMRAIAGVISMLKGFDVPIPDAVSNVTDLVGVLAGR